MNVPAPEDEFWNWFTRVLEPVPREKSPPEPTLVELTNRLRAVDPNLTYEIHATRSGPRCLILSANSIPESFPAVIRLCQHAPLLTHWKLVPFRPRIDLEQYKLELGGLTLTPRDIHFRIEPVADTADIALYIPDVQDADRERVVNLTLVLLDLALGEYDVATRVRSVDHLPKPSDPAAVGLHPLTELPREFDRLQLQRAAQAIAQEG